MTTPTTADPVAANQTVYQVKDFIDAKQLRIDQQINPNDLTGAMMSQAALFSYYGVLAADASKQVDVVKMLLENTEAAVYQLERNAAAAEGEKVTEAMLEKRVARHARVIAMKKALNDAKRVEATGKIAVESFRHRRDMLVQLGLISREEMKGELKIGEKNAREEAVKSSGERALAAIGRRAADPAD